MNHLNQHIKKNRKKRRNNLLYILPIILFFQSCNFFNSELLGKYIREGTHSNTNEIESLSLKKNNVVEIIFKDTLIVGRWNEFDVQEFHYIEVLANNIFKQMTIYSNDSITKLYFVGKPTDFRGGYYDSLSFIKAK